MKRPATPLATPLAAAALALAAACGGAAQSESTTPTDPEVGAETDPIASDPGDAPDALAQAERGASVYASSCGYCHGDEGEGAGSTPAVVGDGVLDSYAHAGEILDYVTAQMPADDPGGLSDEEFQDVVAFMLQANGVDLTGKSVTSATAADISF